MPGRLNLSVQHEAGNAGYYLPCSHILLHFYSAVYAAEPEWSWKAKTED